MSRLLFTFGLFFLGISSLGFNPTSADPWIRPKIVLGLTGLLFLISSSMMDLKKLPDWKTASRIGLALISFSFFLLVQSFYFHYSFMQLSFLFPLCLLSGLALVFQNDFTKDERVHWLSLVFVIQSALAISQFLFFDFFGFQQMGPALKWRTLGLIGNPNQLALFLSLYFFLPGQHLWNSRWSKLKSCLVLIALALTFSRGVFLALLVIALFEFKPVQWKRFLLHILGMIVLFILAETLIGATGLMNSDSVTGRWESYKVFFSDLNQPFEILLLGSRTWDMASPVHNQFLFLLKNFGAVSVLLYCWITLRIYKTARNPGLLLFLFSLYDLPLLNASFVFMLLLILLLNKRTLIGETL